MDVFECRGIPGQADLYSMNLLRSWVLWELTHYCCTQLSNGVLQWEL